MVTRQRLVGRIARLESEPGYWIPKLPDCPDTAQLYESATRYRNLRAAARAVCALILERADHPERAGSLRRGELDIEAALSGVQIDPEEWTRLRNAAARALAKIDAERMATVTER